jgi:hypothetical protein
MRVTLTLILSHRGRGEKILFPIEGEEIGLQTPVEGDVILSPLEGES